MSSKERAFGDPTTLDLRSAARLLGLGAGSRPIDRLLARLDAPDGRRWFDAIMAGPPSSLADLVLLCGPSPVRAERLGEIRATAIGLVGEGRTEEDRLVGLLAYFLANAAATIQLGAPLTSQPLPAVAASLFDLAAALPHPWSEMVRSAALACDGLCDAGASPEDSRT